MLYIRMHSVFINNHPSFFLIALDMTPTTAFNGRPPLYPSLLVAVTLRKECK